MNPNKCVVIVFSRMIMGCIIFRGRTLFDLRIHAIVNMPISINPQ